MRYYGNINSVLISEKGAEEIVYCLTVSAESYLIVKVFNSKEDAKNYAYNTYGVRT